MRPGAEESPKGAGTEEKMGRGQAGEASRPWTWILRERGMIHSA